MLDDEIATLTKDAHVHDYVRIFTIRRLSLRMRSADAAGGYPRPKPGE
ncbi:MULTISPECIES: DUF3562 domain-containing protein [Burkholderia]|nr:hypothetical protein MYA_4892 [Burkholderia sp. KJ006]MBR7908027.1 DUF3562 domain-containing protein [Burkholderia vietnamiensis]MBR8003218.1 DUF3562 domain-containing protein [Burkholderia vietnamiensis]MBR8054973.1 DUF3562 domain-containing protein [Burkholderia vietnamiensis]MBR8230456.1 DUF3562 domain-containing protein [Burkholderia vietnamiensis]